MHKNDLLTLTADAVGADMEGVARHEGMAVFVPGLLPGETAPVRIVKVQSRYAFGKVAGEIVNPSPDRREPDCPAWPRCGGCSCRHMTYAATLEAKRRQVADCFLRIGHLAAEVPPVIGMEEPSHYRNKTALPIGGTADAPVMGFFAPRSHTIIPAERCPNAMAPSGDMAAAFLGWMRDHRIEPYREEEHAGVVRHLVIRVNRAGKAMAAVVTNSRTLPHADDLAQRLAPLGVTSLIHSPNMERTNVILGKTFRTLWGEDTLEDTLCGLTFRLSAASFFQVNPVQTERLYRTALDFAELRNTDTLCDVYCGAGTITLMMAKHCRTALGIEVVPQAIDNAFANAARNGVGNVDFRCGAAEDVLPRLVDEGLRPDVIVVDPPRKGLEPIVVDAIAKAAPWRVVYVSCNVATQARDAALLCGKGYRLDKVQPVDMFCWTSGVECVASFTRID
ncbi:MAG: 23S rRNA (uracil(1939)-C(5))-methyltransferase RlmD [Clostridia bacterium]|nr:23S rRNA (uracil(1939)-C(5))-methyltransferase RlmD [Clostridia bacterium]